MQAVVAQHRGHAQAVVGEHGRAPGLLRGAVVLLAAPCAHGGLVAPETERQVAARPGQAFEAFDRDETVDGFQLGTQAGRDVEVALRGAFVRLDAGLEDWCGNPTTSAVEAGGAQILDIGPRAESLDFTQPATLGKIGSFGNVRAWDAGDARVLLQLSGKEMNRSAVPERAFLRTEPASGGTAIPWPFKRATPEAFAKGAELVPENDRAAFRQGLLRAVEPDARFSFKDETWKVAEIRLIP